MELQPCRELVAVKNFTNYKDDDKSYVKFTQSKVTIYLAIFNNYTKVSSLKEATPCRGNSNGIDPLLDYSTCIRLLYLPQNVFDMRTAAENLVIVTRSYVKTNSDCPVSTGVSIRKETNSRMIQHMVDVADTN